MQTPDNPTLPTHEELAAVELIVVRDILLPFTKWLLDSDGRGAFNPDAITSRVVALAHLCDPMILHGRSQRELADALGLCKFKLSHAVVDIGQQLGLANASTGEFQRAAKKSARRFNAITRDKKRNATPRARV